MKYLIILFILLCVSCGPKIIINESYEELENVLKKDPNNPVAHYNLGLKCFSESEYENAIKYFNSAIERNHHFALAYYGIYCANLLIDTDLRKELLKEIPDEDYQIKIDSLDMLFSNALMYDPYFEWKAGTLLLPKKESAADFYSQRVLNIYYSIIYDGFRHYLLGNYKSSERALTFSLSIVKDFHQARFFRALARGQLKDYEGAISDLDSLIISKEELNKEKILPVYQETAELNYLIGCSYMKLNKYKEAKEHFEKALEEDLSLFMAHYQLSNIYQKLKNYQEAYSEINSALLLQPEDPILLFNKGVFLSNIGKTELAIEAYKAALIKNKFSYKAAYNLGILYEKIDNNDEAKKYYSHFINTAINKEFNLIEETKTKLQDWK